MSTQPKPRDRSAAARIAREEAKLAKFKLAGQQSAQRIAALKAGAKTRDRRAESRDKILIGIAALIAVERDLSLAYSIDTAIDGLNQSAQDHLAREGSLWRATMDAAKIVAKPVVEIVEEQHVDDPDMKPLVIKPDPKEQWLWYDDWDDHGAIFHAMGLTRNSHAMWLAKTYSQQAALAILGRHPDVRLSGLNREECETRISEIAAEELEAMRDLEPAADPPAPKKHRGKKAA